MGTGAGVGLVKDPLNCCLLLAIVRECSVELPKIPDFRVFKIDLIRLFRPEFFSRSKRWI